MGIEGLHQHNRTHASEALFYIERESFRGQAIAVDMMAYCFPLRMTSRKELTQTYDVTKGHLPEDKVDIILVKKLIEKINSFLYYGITPIFVFENGCPDLKMKTRAKRDKERQDTLDKIVKLRKKIKDNPFGDGTRTSIEELKALEAGLKSFPTESKNKIYDFLMGIGIPCILSKDKIEAERVASQLCIADVVCAVYSADGDCLAHGCPILIKGEGERIKVEDKIVETFEVVYLDLVLDSLGLDHDTFQNVCISAGCDYGKIKGISFTTALKFIRLYDHPDNFPEKYDTSTLDFEGAKKEFQFIASKDALSSSNIISFEEWSDIEMKVLELDETPDFFDEYKALSLLNKYRNLVQKMEQPGKFVHRTVIKKGRMKVVDTVLLDGGHEWFKAQARGKKGVQRKKPSVKEEQDSVEKEAPTRAIRKKPTLVEKKSVQVLEEL